MHSRLSYDEALTYIVNTNISSFLDTNNCITLYYRFYKYKVIPYSLGGVWSIE